MISNNQKENNQSNQINQIKSNQIKSIKSNQSFIQSIKYKYRFFKIKMNFFQKHNFSSTIDQVRYFYQWFSIRIVWRWFCCWWCWSWKQSSWWTRRRRCLHQPYQWQTRFCVCWISFWSIFWAGAIFFLIWFIRLALIKFVHSTAALEPFWSVFFNCVQRARHWPGQSRRFVSRTRNCVVAQQWIAQQQFKQQRIDRIRCLRRARFGGRRKQSAVEWLRRARADQNFAKRRACSRNVELWRARTNQNLVKRCICARNFGLWRARTWCIFVSSFFRRSTTTTTTTVFTRSTNFSLRRTRACFFDSKQHIWLRRTR